MKFDFKDIAWVAVVTLIVIFLSKCHREKTDLQDAELNKLGLKIHEDSIETARVIKQYEIIVANKDTIATLYINRNKAIEQQADKQAATVLRLSAALRAYQLPGDSNITTVSHEYIDYCDSLALTSSDLAINFNNYKRNAAFIIAAKDTALLAKDSIIAAERKAKSDCKNGYNALMRIYQHDQSVNKLHSQLYIGAELIGNPNYLISNVGLALTLKTKANKLWQLSGGIMTSGQYYARINGNILISLKR